MGLISWAKNLFSSSEEEVIILKEVVEESMYPEDCIAPRRKIEFLYKSQEVLRSVHNLFVNWRDNGLPEGTWAGLPQNIRESYPYRHKIDAQTWQLFHDEEFMPRSERIINEICVQRMAFKEDAIRDIFNAKGEVNIGEI